MVQTAPLVTANAFSGGFDFLLHKAPKSEGEGACVAVAPGAAPCSRQECPE